MGHRAIKHIEESPGNGRARQEGEKEVNELEEIIQTTDERKAKYDHVIKELLSNKQFLSPILKRFVPEYENIPLEDIENKYIEPGSIEVSSLGVARNTRRVEGSAQEEYNPNEATIYYDIIFKACYPSKTGEYIGMYINVEAQKSYYAGYPMEMRGAYYAARRLGSQLKTISKNTNYGSLHKVYSIWVCMGDVPDKEANTATLYRMEKKDIIGTVKRRPEEYDLMNVIILRINDKKEAEDRVLSMLQTLSSSVLKADEKLKTLKEYGIDVSEEIEEEVKHMCNLSDLLEERLEERIEARIEARVREEMETEVEEKLVRTALNLLKNGLSYETVSKCMNIPIEKIKQWEQEETLQKQ